jgi:hypothetical protein
VNWMSLGGFIKSAGSDTNYHVTGYFVGRSPPWIHDLGDYNAAFKGIQSCNAAETTRSF